MEQPNIPSSPNLKPSTSFLHDALQTLQDPLSFETDQHRAIVHIIKTCSFFKNNLPKHIKIAKFAELTKLHANYEKHPQSTVLQEGKSDAKKFSIILQGTVVKRGLKPASIILERGKSHEFINNYYPGIPLVNQKSSPANFTSSPPKKLLTESSPTSRNFSFQNIADQSTDVQTPENSNKKHEGFSSENNREGFSKYIPSIAEAEADSEDDKKPISLTRMTPRMFSTPAANNLKLSNSTLPEIQDEQVPATKRRIQGRSTKRVSILPIDEAISSTPKNLQQKFVQPEPPVTSPRAHNETFLNDGDYFGEAFCKQPPRTEDFTFIASTEVHLLTLEREAYFTIINELDALSREKLDSFLTVFPAFDEQSVDKFSRYFSQKTFNMDEVIYSQADPCSGLFVLKSGEVKLLKNFYKEEEANIKEVPIVSVVKNQVFGEEALLSQTSRHYTAVANSPNTVVYIMEASVIDKIKIRFGHFFKLLRVQAREKLLWRSQKTLEIFENRLGGSRAPTSLLTYTPKATAVTTLSSPQNSKQVFMFNEVSNSPQKVKPLFHSTLYQPVVERKAFVFSKLNTESEDHPETKRKHKYEKYLTGFSRTYIPPKTETFYGHNLTHNKSPNNFRSVDFTMKVTHPEFNIQKELYSEDLANKKYAVPTNTSPAKKPAIIRAKTKSIAITEEGFTKIILSPLQPLANSTIGTVSIFKEKRPTMMLNKCPSPRVQNLPSIKQSHCENIHVASQISNSPKKIQNALGENIQIRRMRSNL